MFACVNDLGSGGSKSSEGICAKIRLENELRTVGKMPMRGEAAICMEIITSGDAARLRKSGHNVLAPEVQQSAIEAQAIAMTRLREVLPVETRSLKGCGCVGIGNTCA